MKKIGKIDGCYVCPVKRFYTENGVGYFNCTRASDRAVTWYVHHREIPDWCLLEEDT